MEQRRAGRQAAVFFLVATAAYASGNALMTSARGGAGLLLVLLNSVMVVSIGAVLFPLLRRRHERIAVGYLAARLGEAVLLATGAVALVALAEPGARFNALAYQLAMLVLGVGSVFFCALLIRSRLAPAWLGWWGLGGYALLALGAVLELLGWPVGLYLAGPGGLFELTFPAWLLVKGFDDGATVTDKA